MAWQIPQRGVQENDERYHAIMASPTSDAMNAASAMNVPKGMRSVIDRRAESLAAALRAEARPAVTTCPPP